MKGQGYCELQVDLSSGLKISKAIGNIADDCGGAIPANKLHATIMYDVRNPDIFPPKSNAVYNAKVIGIKTLGKPGDKWYACALELNCPEIHARHKELVKAGYVHSYDDLLLHVSLSYGEATSVIAPQLEQMFAEGKLPETITLCNETWDTLED
ncbi:RNA ligase [Pseudomonas phage OBP]|uniref:RNA ligase n=1 Tax=Pseudomonas phage OBP TaxID=1124849 RepID=UPI000240D41B|nr:RNA ligase [Pseudomonas phage OBP]AEV89498.1 RNA ligase [Pseudomonas phage OBP]